MVYGSSPVEQPADQMRSRRCLRALRTVQGVLQDHVLKDL